MKFPDSAKTLLNGFSQVMLQKNPLTGLLFLIGIFLNSWLMGIGALVGVIISTLAAMPLKCRQEDIKNGLYGFNGVLVGISLLFFFEPSAQVFALIAVGSVLSTLVMKFMLEKKLPPYTFPFVISAWIMIIAANYAGLPAQQILGAISSAQIDIFSAFSTGFGQVMFQASIVTGVFFFIAILANSRISALYGLLGSALGVIVGAAFSLPLSLINIGIFGYNGVLSGIAFAEKKASSLIFAIVAILLSIILVFWFNAIGWAALTAPFVFASWIALVVKKSIFKKNAALQ